MEGGERREKEKKIKEPIGETRDLTCLVAWILARRAYCEILKKDVLRDIAKPNQRIINRKPEMTPNARGVGSSWMVGGRGNKL